ncbi:MAG: hypothetical protein JWN02_948 [Acidobacteria bacterium]|nr:hypothetical protein [Acidobacteriota bacterium]
MKGRPEAALSLSTPKRQRPVEKASHDDIAESLRGMMGTASWTPMRLVVTASGQGTPSSPAFFVGMLLLSTMTAVLALHTILAEH